MTFWPGQNIVTTFCPGYKLSLRYVVLDKKSQRLFVRYKISQLLFVPFWSYNNPKSLSTCPKIFRSLMPDTHFLFKLKARLEKIRVLNSSGPCCDRTFKFSLIFFILKIIVHYRQSKQFIGTSTHDGRIYTRSISTHLKRASTTLIGNQIQ